MLEIVSLHACLYIGTHVSIYIYIYLYIYTCEYIHMNIYIYIYIMIASVTLTKRKGHSNRNVESDFKEMLTSELKWNFVSTTLKGVVR